MLTSNITDIHCKNIFEVKATNEHTAMLETITTKYAKLFVSFRIVNSIDINASTPMFDN